MAQTRTEWYRLELPLTAEAVAGWIGMEFEMLLGIADRDAHYTAALNLMQVVLERLDAQASLPEAGTPGSVPPGVGEVKGGQPDASR